MSFLSRGALIRLQIVYERFSVPFLFNFIFYVATKKRRVLPGERLLAMANERETKEIRDKIEST